MQFPSAKDLIDGPFSFHSWGTRYYKTNHFTHLKLVHAFGVEVVEFQ